ncbi:hypothetical protein [Ruegeria jejuensis]|uniref:hypothetical protein n=1 Tax=Ruegeria jejuensis TaxID=3233338 RepID=UPI00355C6BDB
MTPKQQEAVDAMRIHGSQRAAAAALGVSRSTLRSRLDSAKRWEDAPEGQKSAIAVSGLDIGTAKHGWRVIQHDDGSRDSVFWKAEAPAPEEIIESVRGAFEGLSVAPNIDPPSQVMSDLCTVYPVMDLHYGMLAWGKETGGADYSLKEADRDVAYAFAKVMALTPASDTAVLLLPGDTLHADDNRAETPQSKHKLDVDTRLWKVLDNGIEIIDAMIQYLLAKHARVIVRVMRGNHDEHSHLVLSFAIAERYREHSRVEIEKTPRDLFMHRWGRSAIFAHHGDKAKPQQLALYLSDVCEFWSSTRHRYALTGHVHHDQAKDVGPLRWESLRAFCPPDAYAASMGYGARRALQSLTFDKTDGLVLRALDPIERVA